jgi:hypothetical protein
MILIPLHRCCTTLYCCTQHAQDMAIAYNSSGNLNSCGTSTSPAIKWIAYLNETKKTVEYIPSTLTAAILSNGIRVNASLQTNFTVPVWAGACGWGAVVTDKSKWGMFTKLIQPICPVLASFLVICLFSRNASDPTPLARKQQRM